MGNVLKGKCLKNIILAQVFCCDLCQMKFEKYEELAQHNTETHPGNLFLVGEEDPLQEPLVLTTQGLLQTAAR